MDEEKIYLKNGDQISAGDRISHVEFGSGKVLKVVADIKRFTKGLCSRSLMQLCSQTDGLRELLFHTDGSVLYIEFDEFEGQKEKRMMIDPKQADIWKV